MEVIALYFGNVRLDFNAVLQYVQLVKASLKIFSLRVESLSNECKACFEFTEH